MCYRYFPISAYEHFVTRAIASCPHRKKVNTSVESFSDKELTEINFERNRSKLSESLFSAADAVNSVYECVRSVLFISFSFATLLRHRKP